jgi:hypothetical protein
MWLRRGVAMVALVVGVGAPAGATTLIRASLDRLVAGNSAILVGEVLDAYSYWNQDGSFILTDVRVAVEDHLKGDPAPGEVTVTVMGGSVGDLTTLIVAGAELIPGRSYVLFLNQEDLPGAPAALTVRDHCQGVFELRSTAGGLRAVSQANRHPLVPDALGYVDAPGGVEGFPLAAMIRSIRELAAGEVKP